MKASSSITQSSNGAAKDDVTVQTHAETGSPILSLNAALFKEVTVALRAKLGEMTLTVEDLLALKAGSIVKLDAKLNDLVELHLNQTVVARGELVAVGDNFGLRIVELAQTL